MVGNAMKDRLWVVAAVPLALMIVLGALLAWTNLAKTISPIPCVLLLVASLVAGVGVFAAIAVRTWRGERPFRRGLVWLAAVLAALDVLIPVGLVALALLIARGLSKRMS